jgi:FkbM family methyltransferase
MTHRYLRPTWWISRLAGEAERFIPPRRTMPALVWAAMRSGEPELRRLEELVPRNSVALDVGANRGIYTWRLARLARHVHAFEPQPELAARLRFAVPEAEVHALALSDRDGEAELRIPLVAGVAYHGWGTIEPKNRLDAVRCSDVRSIPVPLRRLDSFGFDDIGFIKIDVEGHEPEVLAGATETLRLCRPNLLIEAEDRRRPDAVRLVRDFLSSFGYQGCFLDGDELLPINRFIDRQPDDRCRASRYVYNFLFLSKERYSSDVICKKCTAQRSRPRRGLRER